MKMHRAIAIGVGLCLGVPVATLGATQTVSSVGSVVRDGGHGVIVRATRAPGGSLSLEAVDGEVSVRKDVTAGRSATVIRAGSDTLTLVVDRNGVTVETADRRIAVPKGQPERIRLLTGVLSGSPAVKKAVAMLGRLTLAADSPAGQAFLITRALLQSAQGDPSATWLLADGLHRAALRPQVVLAETGSSPTQCWNDYTAAADAAWSVYESCFNSASWWDIVTKSECAAIYDLQAEGAFSWYLNCVGVQVL